MIEQSIENELKVEVEAEEDDGDVFAKFRIKSYPSDLPLFGIAKMHEDGDIVIPDYQRGFVWSIEQSSLLIDSFLCGLPIPPVFFYRDEDQKNVVIDGQQRIMSVVFYLNGFFGKENARGQRKVFRLSGDAISSSPHNGKSFVDLDVPSQRMLKQAVLRAMIIEQLDPQGETSSAYHIFERLNTGGTPLRPQEIRNCVFQGKFNDALKKANEDKNWRKILGKLDHDKRQKDVELLLRVFALAVSGDRYEKPMKEFLNVQMKKQNISKDNGEAKGFFKSFTKVADVVATSMGRAPFHLRGPLNGSALDSVMSVLIKNAHRLDGIDVKKRFDVLCTDDEFLESTWGKTTDTRTVRARLKKVEEVFFG